MKRDKTLSRAELELTHRIQLHFPSGINQKVIHAWNSCNVKVLQQKLNDLFGQIPQPEKSQILRLISKPGEIILPPTNGKKTFAKAEDIFTSHLDSNFKNWVTNEPSVPTKKQPVSVYKMVQNANFADMFGSLHSNLDKLCLTQHQIILFVQDYRSWLRKDGYGTFFLFKAAGEFFVAIVPVRSDGKFYIDIYRFGNVGVWGAGSARRVVVPQLR